MNANTNPMKKDNAFSGALVLLSCAWLVTVAAGDALAARPAAAGTVDAAPVVAHATTADHARG